MNIEMSSSARSGTGNCVKEGLKKVYEKIDTPKYLRNSFLTVCVVALAIDPLFLFIPEIDYQKSCIGFDKTLGRAVSNLRSLIDGLYLMHMIVSIFIPLRSKMSGRKQYIFSIVDIVSIVPIPHVMVFHLLRNKGGVLSGVKENTQVDHSWSVYTKNHSHLSDLQRSDKNQRYSSKIKVDWSSYKPFALPVVQLCVWGFLVRYCNRKANHMLA
ncbi:PREDICTED: cyclic nucleotide-gated ion channel 11 isoform X2 [Camelina sativa]|uniref:Cyclic nucleotide-gated ion channel 11 isoform X2 n=1 Tax=Camelina sativa TaxID=90675 RepID=A0ABM0ZJW2_CAMSA|nr:PREDICTED: cyclic nucleotide-gated ion channel 11 isoform X2 [Camelina sativa]XP_010516786.1 PREDICTED: cyclic nucleotide-gated ion channel 11 isoform X2 [Camelina sativa]